MLNGSHNSFDLIPEPSRRDLPSSRHAPRGLGLPSVVSRAVWCSISALSWPPRIHVTPLYVLAPTYAGRNLFSRNALP